MNALDSIVSLTLDMEPCRANSVLAELCETHGYQMQGAECAMVVERRRDLSMALGDAMPVIVDWVAGMIEGAAEDMADDVGHSVVAGMRGAAGLVRRWDYQAEFPEDA